MRVLIVEDNEFNAFCLRRLVESVMVSGRVTVVNNSNAALSLFYSNPFDLVIIDGGLGAVRGNGTYCNGPELAQILLYKYPSLPLIAWTDSTPMRQAFADIFKQHDRPINECTLWNKTVTVETIGKAWSYYFAEFLGGQNIASNQPHLAYC
jgi:CheY-like chemotaxis protein